MRRIAALATILLAAAVSPAVSGDVPEPTPVVHEEITRAWDHVTSQLEKFGSVWREHFRADAGSSERPLITLMLRHREELRLSADQVRSLERLRGEFEREAVRREADIRIAEMDLASLLDARPVDLAKVEAKIREIERFKADLRLARIRAIEQGKALLSPEQQAKLNDLITGPRFSSRTHGRSSR
jgi:Spy/CpxP family protein refolding chaperone